MEKKKEPREWRRVRNSSETLKKIDRGGESICTYTSRESKQSSSIAVRGSGMILQRTGGDKEIRTDPKSKDKHNGRSGSEPEKARKPV